MVLSRFKQRLLLFALILSAMITAINLTMAISSLPMIEASLGASLLQLKWFIALYLIAQAGMMVNMVRVGVLYGLRRVYYFGVIGIIVLALIAGFSHHMSVLLVCRFLMGLLSTIPYTLPVIVIFKIIPDDQEARKNINLIQNFVGIALAFGVTVGAVISAYLGWRWIFLINVPFLLLSLACFLYCFPKISVGDTSEHHSDWVGAICLFIAIALMVFSLIEATHYGLLSLVIVVPFFVSLVLFFVFIVWEKRHHLPIIDPVLFCDRYFLSGVICSLFLAFFYSSTFFITPLYLVFFCHYPVSYVGFIFLPLSVSIVCFSWLQARLIQRFSPKVVLLWSQALFVVTFAYISVINTTPNLWTIIVAFILLGSAWSFCLATSVVAAVSRVSHDKKASVVGVIWTTHGIGGSLGIAVGMIIYHHYFFDFIHKKLLSVAHVDLGSQVINSIIANPGKAIDILHSHTSLPMHELTAIFRHSFSFGFTALFVVNLCIAVLMFVLLLFLYPKQTS